MDYPAQISNDKSAGVLSIEWQDGGHQQWRHAVLRASCKCTLCQSQRLRNGHSEPVANEVRIVELKPVGAYGLQLLFTDGHQKGIYPWQYLRGLAN